MTHNDSDPADSPDSPDSPNSPNSPDSPLPETITIELPLPKLANSPSSQTSPQALALANPLNLSHATAPTLTFQIPKRRRTFKAIKNSPNTLAGKLSAPSKLASFATIATLLVWIAVLAAGLIVFHFAMPDPHLTALRWLMMSFLVILWAVFGSIFVVLVQLEKRSQ